MKFHYSLSLLPVLALASGAVGATEIPLSEVFVVEAGFSHAYSVVSADLDGDGDLDLFASAESGDALAWFENTDGDGAAWTRHDLPSSLLDTPRSVAAGDLDGDGDVDLVATAWGSDEVRWWENALDDVSVCGSDFCGHGIAEVTSADGLALGDLDRDGDLDVVVTMRGGGGGGKIIWLQNGGAGAGWTWNQIFSGFSGAQEVALADLDADGDLDVVAGAGEDGGAFGWWENAIDDSAACSGAPWCVNLLDTAGVTDSVGAADVDGDGDLDLLRGETGAVSWWENTAGDASTWTEHLILSETGRAGIAGRDMDGDGDLDVVGLDGGGWVENAAGDGSTWVSRSLGESSLFDVEAVDLDGDGDLDLVNADRSGDRLLWWENETLHRSATFGDPVAASGVMDGAIETVAADLDGDGDLDLVYTEANDDELSGGTASVLWAENDGSPGVSGWTERTLGGSLAIPAGLVVDDFDGDGDPDVAVAVNLGGTVQWYQNDGTPLDGGWTAHQVTSGFAAVRLESADVDGDGDPDLVGTEQAFSGTDDRLAWWENDGTPDDGDWAHHDLATALADPLGLDAGDVDGDGDVDVVVAVETDDQVLWFESDGTPLDGGWSSYVLASLDGAADVELCDVDADGDLDAVVTEKVGDRVLWIENDGLWTLGGATSHEVATAFDAPVGLWWGDLDADGDADVAVAATDGKISAFLNDGTPTDGGWVELAVATDIAGAQGVVAADLDGDGRVDLAAGGKSEPEVGWWSNLGGQLALPTEDAVAATEVLAGTADVSLLRIDGAHRGRSGDGDGELATLELRFEDETETALSSEDLDLLVDTLRLYLDDGDGSFDPAADGNFFSVGSPFTLADGVLTLSMVDADPSVQVALGAGPTWWLTADLAAAAPASSFRVTHLTSSSSTGEMAITDIPLLLEGQTDVASSLLSPQPGYLLTVATAGAGSGSVSAPPHGIDCTTAGGDCSEVLIEGTEVSLVAGADEHSVFAGWSGDADCDDGVVTMSGDRSCTATFDLDDHTLTVTVSGTGTVESSPSGIVCDDTDPTCSAVYEHGTVITLATTPGPDFTFAGWSGDADCADGSVTLDSDLSCTATFALVTYDVFISVNGTGRVVSTPAGIDCGNGGTDCTESWETGTEVSFVTTPAEGWSFIAWFGSGCGESIVVDQDLTCTGSFEEDRTLTVTIAGEGQVTSSPAGIDCGGGASSCAAEYAFLTDVSLTPTPDEGWRFSGWSGDADCDDGIVRMNADVACTATFTLQQHTLSIAVAGLGNVASSPGIDCGDGGVDCEEIYDHGTLVILTPTAGTGYDFTGFSGDADCSDGEVTMTADVACTATFIAFGEGVVIFLDGFESGDTSSWSATGP